MSANNKNFVNLDKMNAGKHCNYGRKHINNARLSTCTTVVTSLSVSVHTPKSINESWTFNNAGK